ncbi:MAG: serine/threonine protein kinase [Verrucomicrobiota bacterium]|nr:serine/threonine protein kinase [Verrucomicrobiota bacterium]
MGVVYKARQKALNRTVALKLLAPERVGDPKFAERFTHEAQALAKLTHPSIVTVYDFGQAGGFYYLLMEFVDGVNLRQAMKVGRFTPEQALTVVPPVCEALQYAHERGIVHRDIKPENLLLDREGRIKIADFGVAKILGHAPSVGLAETQPAGTPQYMAPEQKAKRATDHRADIYSLGVVLYELLTGELPAQKIAAPSRKVSVDVRIDEIVLRALEKSPELRWQTAEQFRTQVDTVLGGSATSAATKRSAQKAPFEQLHRLLGRVKRKSSNPELFANCSNKRAAVIALVVVALGVLGIWFEREQRSAPAFADSVGNEGNARFGLIHADFEQPVTSSPLPDLKGLHFQRALLVSGGKGAKHPEVKALDEVIAAEDRRRASAFDPFDPNLPPPNASADGLRIQRNLLVARGKGAKHPEVKALDEVIAAEDRRRASAFDPFDPNLPPPNASADGLRIQRNLLVARGKGVKHPEVKALDEVIATTERTAPAVTANPPLPNAATTSIPPRLQIEATILKRDADSEERRVAAPRVIVFSGREAVVQMSITPSQTLEFRFVPTLLDDGSVQLRASLNGTGDSLSTEVTTKLGHLIKVQFGQFAALTRVSLFAENKANADQGGLPGYQPNSVDQSPQPSQVTTDNEGLSDGPEAGRSPKPSQFGFRELKPAATDRTTPLNQTVNPQEKLNPAGQSPQPSRGMTDLFGNGGLDLKSAEAGGETHFNQAVDPQGNRPADATEYGGNSRITPGGRVAPSGNQPLPSRLDGIPREKATAVPRNAGEKAVSLDVIDSGPNSEVVIRVPLR